MKIKKIRLQGYKSAADIVLEDISPFAVFAGANGAGKSNLADGLAFFGNIVKFGVYQAMLQAGGFKQVHCYKLGKKARTKASLELEITHKDQDYSYTISLEGMDNLTPELSESLRMGNEEVMVRKGSSMFMKKALGEDLKEFSPYPSDMPALMMASDFPFYDFLTNIRVFRFDPLGAKEPDSSSTQTAELDAYGRNVASMLGELLKDPDTREDIIEWLELLVPGMEKVSTEKQKLDGSTALKFKEKGITAPFPANLVSDGTIYALCIMTAVLSRRGSKGITFIEEPERGIHPQAIAELVDLMRDNATTDQPVFVTTHSESVVRSSQQQELWLINKVDGKTRLKNAAANGFKLETTNLDTAWLMNLFDGGLPW